MIRIFSFALIMAGSLALPAFAGTELASGKNGVALVPPPGNVGAVAPSQQASTVREPKKAGQRLRCWQSGRLLYESTGFRADAERRPNAVTIPRVQGDGVVVFDNKDSVCILSDK